MPEPKAKTEPINYLLEGKVPETVDEFYKNNKTPNEDFGEIWGPETHGRRRKLILDKHPEVAQLLVADKPYSTILTLLLVPLGLAVNYMVKVHSF